MAVVLETTIGDITIDLYIRDRPRTCLNFLKLCKVKYYNFSTFHKIERNFIAQTGDPTGTGRGGESVFFMLYGDQAKFFDAEVSPRLKHKKLGTVSMVNNGDNAHGSQFFITLGENLDYLDGVHTVFGEVTEGLEVLAKLNDAICDEEHRPFQDILITHTVTLDDPFDDPPGLVIPDCSPEPTSEHLKSSRIGAAEDIDDTKGKSMDEIEEEIKTKEAKARATILEMIGDIPDAEVKPPDTVLFVCKLNPVTTAEDLEVIFSRFGVIKNCEVICDKKTGESLQYAFIEFEKPEDCENAYFKMDNVLIDDRRIHVDFSQSVSKLKWKSKDKNKTNFVIKEKAQSLKDNRYEMVFDDSEGENDLKIISSKKKHKDRESSVEMTKEVGDKHFDKHQSKKHSKKKHTSESDTNLESPKHIRSPSEETKQSSKVKIEKNVSESNDSESDSAIKHEIMEANRISAGKCQDSNASSSDGENYGKNRKTKKKRKSKSPVAYHSPEASDNKNSKTKSFPRKDGQSSSESPGRTTSSKSKRMNPSDEHYDRSNSARNAGSTRSRSRSRSRNRDYVQKRREAYGRESQPHSSRHRSPTRPDMSRRGDRDRRNEREYKKRDDSQASSRRRWSRTPPRSHNSQSGQSFRGTHSSRDRHRRNSRSRASRSRS